MLRATVDTNVWVSGVNWPKGKPGQLLTAAQTRWFTHVTSLEILFEITRVLREYFGYTDEDAYHWYLEIGGLSEIVRPVERLNVIHADPSDNKFLECAVAGLCEYVVSGDRHLLDLQQYREIVILSVAEFLSRVTESHTTRHITDQTTDSGGMENP